MGLPLPRTATGLSTKELERLFASVSNEEHSAKYSAAQRKKAAKEGAALPDGSYPIYDQEDVDNAAGLSGSGSAAKSMVVAHVRRRAKALGLKLPASYSDKGSS